MKFRTTRSAIKKGFCKVYSVSFCGLQNLLYYEKPVAYTCGVYGWNCDIFDFGNFAISTGYRPFGESIAYELVEYYDSKAKEVLYSTLSYEDKKKRVKELVDQFIESL